MSVDLRKKLQGWRQAPRTERMNDLKGLVLGALLGTAMTTAAQAEGGLRGEPGEPYVMMGHP
jgi:hypothetical protein